MQPTEPRTGASYRQEETWHRKGRLLLSFVFVNELMAEIDNINTGASLIFKTEEV